MGTSAGILDKLVLGSHVALEEPAPQHFFFFSFPLIEAALESDMEIWGHWGWGEIGEE